MKKIVLIACLISSFVCAAEPPLIGITSVFKNPNDSRFGKIETQMSYVTAVQQAGGVPVVLPTIADSALVQAYLQKLDGLVLVGGADVWPSFYDEKPHPTVDTLSVQRFTFEKMLIDRWLYFSNKPVLGICLGSQFSNVVLGGSLYQDIPSQVGKKVIHRNKEGARHKVVIDPDSRLFSILQSDTVVVNSYHHQAVKSVAPRLKVVARALDGVVEATELKDENRFALFVQWHPEAMDAYRIPIFQPFIQAAVKEYENTKK